MNLNQITIPSEDVASSSEFYSTLGLTMIVDALPKYVRFICPEGDSTFSISRSESKSSRAQSGVHIYFECPDLDMEVQRLKEAGLEFIQDPEDKSWLWREARLYDPDGHIILYYAGKNRKNPPWRIHSRY